MPEGSQHRSNDMNSAYLSHINHEIQGSLSAIRGCSDNLKDGLLGPMNDIQVESCSLINLAVGNLSTFIRNLVDLERLEGGSIKAQTSAVNLQSAITKSVSQASHIAKQAHITVEETFTKQALRCHTDPRLLERVLNILLDNAVGFTPEGGHITLSCSPRDDALEISVTDTGIGIPQDQQGMVFHKFERFSNPLRGCKGYGLGLTVAKEISAILGGALLVESQPGSGSTFSLRLPTLVA